MTTLTLIMAFIGIQNGPDSFFESADQFFKTYVNDGRVDYQRLVDDPTDLDDLYYQINQLDLKGKSESFEKAFYINAYNILVIKQVVDLYPIKSPLENNGFFNATRHVVAGKKKTLDGVEKETLLKKYPDPRIHFAVVCAAVGCPPIYSGAFTPGNVDQLLEERTKYALNDDYFTRASENKLELSQIFNWYKSDFITKGAGLRDFVNQYRTNKIPEGVKVSFYEYDWNLNIK